MTDRDAVNLPDVLGTITEEMRINVDVVQGALAVRPSTPPAGQPFEAILLLQNASDINVDVTATLKLPQRDAKNQRNRFFAKTERLLVGLRPAEVGYLVLPVSSSPQTAPAPDYTLEMQLQVKRVDDRRPQRVRAQQGGGFFVETELADDVQEHIWKLHQLVFSAEHAGRSGITASFGIRPPSLAKPTDFSPEWISLWTMRDHMDERILVDRVRDALLSVLPAFKRDNLFMPLMQRLQERMTEAGYTLQAAEAVMITKLLVLMLEGEAQSYLNMGGPGDSAAYPQWLLRISRMLFDKPEAASRPTFLALYALDDLLHDAVRLGFTMVATVTKQDFGGEASFGRYAADFAACLSEGRLSFERVYLPLVMAGLIANTRIVMPQEQPRETVWMLSQAREQRSGEMNQSNHYIFALAGQLIDRALEQTG